MPDIQVYLQAMYKEQCDQARQHETLRQTATALLLSIATAVATLEGVGISNAGKLTSAIHANLDAILLLFSLPGMFIIFLSQFGKRLSLKHYERNRHHGDQARAYRKKLEDLFPGEGLKKLRDDAYKAHEKAWKGNEEIVNAELFNLWADIFTLVMVLGIGLVLLPIAIAISHHLKVSVI